MIKYDQKSMRDQTPIPVKAEYDVIVAGGGIAGVAAGMAAAKRGCRTLIIESTSALGGMATMGLTNLPMDFISGLGEEMIDELEAVNAHWHRNTDPEKHKLVLDRMICRYRCDVLLVTQVINAVMEGNTIRGVVVQTKTGPEVMLAKRVIDCSGDSDIAFYSGAKLMKGRPGDGMSQACTLMFIMGGVDLDEYLDSDVFKKDPKWLEIIKTALTVGDMPYEVENHLNWMTHLPSRPRHCGKDEVSICFSHSRNCYPSDNRDLTRMYLEGREQADIISRFIIKRIPGFENAYLSYTAPQLRVRESRRIVGEYILTADDIAHLRKFDDVIAISMSGFDVHNFDAPGNIKWAPIKIDGKRQYVISSSDGLGTTTPPPNGAQVVNVKGQNANDAVFDVSHYDIPWRCLVPVSIDNLLAGGRNISADVFAQSGTRLVMTCFSLGEVAGTAAALSIAEGISFRQMNRIRLQEELIASNVNIGQGTREIPGIRAIEPYQEKYPRSRPKANIIIDDSMKPFIGIK